MRTITIITDEKTAEALIPGDLDLVFSTTHPPTKEQVNVLYHDDGVRV